MGDAMFDVAMRRELAAMVWDRAEETTESDEERRFLVLAADCEEFAASLHPSHTEGLLAAG